jgi:hypothetical protein
LRHRAGRALALASIRSENTWVYWGHDRRDCQRAGGSAFAAILIVPADGLRLSGELRYHAVTSERNTRIERGFCPTCGSPIAGRLGARSDVVILQAASLDDPSMFSPQMNIWTRSTPPWHQLDPKLPSFETRAG